MTSCVYRKRAKTEEEKEQRHVERVLRNRRSAHNSRERRKLEVEELDKRNQELELLLDAVKRANAILIQELGDFKGRDDFDACYFALLESSQAKIRPSERVSPLSIQTPVVQISTISAPESTFDTINPKLISSELGTAGTGKEIMNTSTQAAAAHVSDHTTTEIADASQVSVSHPTSFSLANIPSSPLGCGIDLSPMVAWMQLPLQHDAVDTVTPTDPYLGNEAENIFQDILAANQSLSSRFGCGQRAIEETQSWETDASECSLLVN